MCTRWRPDHSEHYKHLHLLLSQKYDNIWIIENLVLFSPDVITFSVTPPRTRWGAALTSPSPSRERWPTPSSGPGSWAPARSTARPRAARAAGSATWCPGPRSRWSSTGGSRRCPLTPATDDSTLDPPSPPRSGVPGGGGGSYIFIFVVQSFLPSPPTLSLLGSAPLGGRTLDPPHDFWWIRLTETGFRSTTRTGPEQVHNRSGTGTQQVHNRSGTGPDRTASARVVNE